MLQSIAVCGMDSRKVRMLQSRTYRGLDSKKVVFYRSEQLWNGFQKRKDSTEQSSCGMDSRKAGILQKRAVRGMNSRKVRILQKRAVVEWIPEKQGFYRKGQLCNGFLKSRILKIRAVLE